MLRRGECYDHQFQIQSISQALSSQSRIRSADQTERLHSCVHLALGYLLVDIDALIRPLTIGSRICPDVAVIRNSAFGEEIVTGDQRVLNFNTFLVTWLLGKHVETSDQGC